MKKLLILMLTAPLAAVAQNNGAAPSAEGAAAAVPAPVDPGSPASRFVAVASQKDYLLMMKNKLAINTRDRGPFGLFQVPGKTPTLMPAVMERRKKKTVTPFTDFVRAIRVSVIFADDQEFLVGSRIFRRGQVFPLVAGDQKIKVRIEEIKPTSVAFRNLNSNEVAVKRLDLLPAGVQLGGGKDGPIKGVTPRSTSDAQPLHLDLLSPPPTP